MLCRELIKLTGAQHNKIILIQFVSSFWKMAKLIRLIRLINVFFLKIGIYDGVEYKGYLVVVYDESGRPLVVKSSSEVLASNIGYLTPLKIGARFPLSFIC